MRFLFLTNLYPPNAVGGYERICHDVATALVERGHEVHVLTSTYGTLGGGKAAEQPGQSVRREWELLTGPDIYDPFPGTPEDRAAVNARNLATLRRTLEEVRPDRVFAWNLFFLDASILDELERGPHRAAVMLTDNWLLVMRNPQFVADFFRDVVHGAKPFVPPPQPSPLRRMLRPVVRRVLGREQPPGLDAVFGAGFVRDFYAAGGVRFRRDAVIHNGVRDLRHGTGSAPPDRTRLVEPGTLRLLFAGRLVELKGAHDAVAAMKLLDPASLGVQRVSLSLVGDGRDAAYMRQLQDAIAASGRGADITLAPAVPERELAALFDAHDVYVFPSLYEPFSLTLIQALACGIPTVASRAGGNPEIVRDGETGLLFEKGDPAGLARAVARLAQDPPLRARLARGGQEAGARFTSDRMVDGMERFLGSASLAPSGPRSQVVGT